MRLHNGLGTGSACPQSAHVHVSLWEPLSRPSMASTRALLNLPETHTKQCSSTGNPQTILNVFEILLERRRALVDATRPPHGFPWAHRVSSSTTPGHTQQMSACKTNHPIMTVGMGSAVLFPLHPRLILSISG